MDLMQAMSERHSVRDFKDEPISEEHVSELSEFIEQLNNKSGLHMQLILNEPKAFNSLGVRLITYYGNFRNVNNYIALIGRKSDTIEERCGYYGEQVVLKAQQMGLRTCWVGGTYRKVPSVCEIGKGEKIVAVIAIGYGNEDGHPHKSKAFNEVVLGDADYPIWFRKGVNAALLAPTAMDQQRFMFELKGNKVKLRAFPGPFSKLDLGIVKYHFEAASGIKVS
ncbi:MAG: nitroreductase [Mogibacterium sp.]|nr:nitroreductase [Mogibacterium sp.]